jgi:serine/threonine protein kinase
MNQLPLRLARDIGVLEVYLETSGAGHVFQGRLENIPGLLGELMIAGEADPGIFGLDIPFTFGKGPIESSRKIEAIRARAEQLWKEFQRCDPARAEDVRGRYLRAVDARLPANPNVAVKILRRGSGGSGELRSFASLFVREDEALRRLNHGNILRRYACLVDPRLGPYTILERVRGRSLEGVLRLRGQYGTGPLPLAAVGKVALQLAHTLGYAHARGVVHGDFRPLNVRLLKAEAGDGKTGAIVKILGLGSDGPGDPAYAAPEQARGEGASPATDVYQLGLTLFAVATGTLPDGDSDFFRRRVHHFRPEVGPRLENAIEGAREKDQAKRWPLDRVVEALTEVCASKSFTLDQGPRAGIAEELLERAQANAALKDYYRAFEALDLARDFLEAVPEERARKVRSQYEQVAARCAAFREPVEAIRRICREHIAPVDGAMTELYTRYGRGEPILTDEEKGRLQDHGTDVVVLRRSLFDRIIEHTSAAIRELGLIDPESVGEIHRKMVDRASSQETAVSDLAAKLVKFGDDYLRSDSASK